MTGAGKTKAWAVQGRNGILVGCRYCGGVDGGLDRAAFRAHLQALAGGEAAVSSTAPSVAEQAPAEPQSPLPGIVWSASVSLPVDGPGHRYLVRRGVWAAGEPVPGPVRWLSASAAARVECRPVLPAGSAGAILYRYGGPGEAETNAVQLEAVDGAGRVLECKPGVRRASVWGSAFDAGRRVFRAAAGDGQPSSGTWLTEGPIDALAIVRLGRLGHLDVGGAAVLGASGTPGFRARAIHEPGPVVLAPDRDAAGTEAGDALQAALVAAGRRCRLCRPAGGDWGQVAAEVAGERAAIQGE